MCGKRSNTTISMQPATSPVSEALIFICEKCGKKLASGDENPARELQQAIKSEIKNIDGKGRWRASVTSCMDLCPKGEVAICISSPNAPNRFVNLADGFQGDYQGTALAVLAEAKK